MRIGKKRCNDVHCRPILHNRVPCIYLIAPLRDADVGLHLDQCETLLRYLKLATSSVAGTWLLVYDGSKQHSGWFTADLDAVHALSPLLFADGFESGGTSAWSATVP